MTAPLKNISAYDADFGVSHVGCIDPGAKLLDVLQLREGAWLFAATFADNGPVEAPPIATHAFDLGILWPAYPGAPGS